MSAIERQPLTAELRQQLLQQWQEEQQPGWYQREQTVRRVGTTSLTTAGVILAGAAAKSIQDDDSSGSLFKKVAGAAVGFVVFGAFCKMGWSYWSDPHYRMSCLLGAERHILEDDLSLPQIREFYPELVDKGVITPVVENFWLRNDLARMESGDLSPKVFRERHSDELLIDVLDDDNKARIRTSTGTYLWNIAEREPEFAGGTGALIYQWDGFLDEMGCSAADKRHIYTGSLFIDLGRKAIGYPEFRERAEVVALCQSSDAKKAILKALFTQYAAQSGLGLRELKARYAMDLKLFNLRAAYEMAYLKTDWQALLAGKFMGGWNIFVSFHGCEALQVLKQYDAYKAQTLLQDQIVWEMEDRNEGLTATLGRHGASVEALEMNLDYGRLLETEIHWIGERGYASFRQKHFPHRELPLIGQDGSKSQTLLQMAFLNMPYDQMTTTYGGDLPALGLSKKTVQERVCTDFFTYSYLGKSGMRAIHGLNPFIDGVVKKDDPAAEKVREELWKTLPKLGFHEFMEFEYDLHLLGIELKTVLKVHWESMPLREIMEKEGDAFFARVGKNLMFEPSEWTAKVKAESETLSFYQVLDLDVRLLTSGILWIGDYREAFLSEAKGLPLSGIIKDYGWRLFDWGFLKKGDALLNEKLEQHLSLHAFENSLPPTSDPLWEGIRELLPESVRRLIQVFTEQWEMVRNASAFRANYFRQDFNEQLIALRSFTESERKAVQTGINSRQQTIKGLELQIDNLKRERQLLVDELNEVIAADGKVLPLRADQNQMRHAIAQLNRRLRQTQDFQNRQSLLQQLIQKQRDARQSAQELNRCAALAEHRPVLTRKVAEKNSEMGALELRLKDQKRDLVQAKQSKGRVLAEHQRTFESKKAELSRNYKASTEKVAAERKASYDQLAKEFRAKLAAAFST